MLKFKTSCAVLAYLSSNLLNKVGLSLFRYFKVGLRVCDIVVKKFTFAISSPDEFLYMDILVNRLRIAGHGCYLLNVFYGCLLFADDIVLLSHSVPAMRRMMQICDEFAVDFDVKFNSTKSVAMRIGCRYNATCKPLELAGDTLKYVESVKYLGDVCLIASTYLTRTHQEMR